MKVVLEFRLGRDIIVPVNTIKEASFVVHEYSVSVSYSALKQSYGFYGGTLYNDRNEKIAYIKHNGDVWTLDYSNLLFSYCGYVRYKNDKTFDYLSLKKK